MSTRPGGAVATRPLYFYWVIDTSDSMNYPPEKIGALNHAASEVIPELFAEAEKNPNAQVYVRRMKFSDQASWIENAPIELKNFAWDDIVADGKMTDMSLAYKLLNEELENFPERGLPPVIVFLTDGQPTQFSGDSDKGKALDLFLKSPWAKKAVRIAIAIGKDAAKDELTKFTQNVELVLEVHTASRLAKAIKWASTVALRQASRMKNKDSTTNSNDFTMLPNSVQNINGSDNGGKNLLPPPTLPPLANDDDDEYVF